MMRVLYVDAAGQPKTLTELPPTWQATSPPEQSLLWLDLDAADGLNEIEQLWTERFGFHPLAIDDALNETHIPKLDDWESYLYLTLQDVALATDSTMVSLPELDLFLGKRYLVTYHVEPITAVNRVWQLCQRNPHWLQHGSNQLLYRLIDELVDDYTLVLEQLEGGIVQLESEIFANPTANVLEHLTAYKRIVLHLQRTLAPQREVVSKLSRNPHPLVGSNDQLYFRDVYDHMVRLYDLSDNVRELLMGSMEIYLTVINNRMNDIMKTLTIITTLFMPLTFITGFFGMNFFQAVLPSQYWTGMGMLIVTLLSLVLLPLIMFYWMRQRAWM